MPKRDKIILCIIQFCNNYRKKYTHRQDDIASRKTNMDLVPESLQLLLTTVFSGKDVEIKVASIGQAIMQAARLRILICPLQLGLAMQMHYCFDLKFLIDTLYSLGFSLNPTMRSWRLRWAQLFLKIALGAYQRVILPNTWLTIWTTSPRHLTDWRRSMAWELFVLSRQL